MSVAGTPVTKSPLLAAAERVIEILTAHPELESTISTITIYGPNAIPDTGNVGILADGKDAVLQQWDGAIAGRITLEGRDLPESRHLSWMGAMRSADETISVTISTDRPKA